jgi:DNA-binding NtrC family response regulator
VTGSGSREPRSRSLAEVGDSLGLLAEALLDRGVSLHEALQAFEARYVKAALLRSADNISQAAETLGIHRNTLRWKLQRNGRRPRRRGA